MSELKKRGPDERDPNLKKEDQRKSQASEQTGFGGIDFSRGKKATGNRMGPNVKVKKKLPLAADIIVGILMIALLCGVIVGSYMLFRYYSNDYETRSVTYTVVFRGEDELHKYATMKNGELYMDVNGNSLYFGKISEVRTVERYGDDAPGDVVLKVSVQAKYRRGEGYSIGEQRLAVGSEYELRHLESSFYMAVVELAEAGGK